MSAGETDADVEGEATVGVVIGPQYGPVTAAVVDNLIKPAGPVNNTVQSSGVEKVAA